MVGNLWFFFVISLYHFRAGFSSFYDHHAQRLPANGVSASAHNHARPKVDNLIHRQDGFVAAPVQAVDLYQAPKSAVPLEISIDAPYSEIEKKKFMQAFIEKIELHPDKPPDANWLKHITFNVPKSREALETVMSLVQQQPDDLVKVGIDADKLAVTKAESKATYGKGVLGVVRLNEARKHQAISKELSAQLADPSLESKREIKKQIQAERQQHNKTPLFLLQQLEKGGNVYRTSVRHPLECLRACFNIICTRRTSPQQPSPRKALILLNYSSAKYLMVRSF